MRSSRSPGPTPEPLRRVLAVASEMFPFVKTGGLADVTGALPGALAATGTAVCTLLPGYPAVIAALRDPTILATWPDWFGGSARLLMTPASVAPALMVLDAPHLYDRPGNPYLDAAGRDWPDNPERFAALSLAAVQVGSGAFDAFVPDLLHAHDWQAALVPTYQRFLGDDVRRLPTVLTVHNLAFQGQFAARVFERLRLPRGAFTADALEYFGDVGFLKSGLLLADAITTVSPTYAREIRTPRDGMGMDALLRHRAGSTAGAVGGAFNGTFSGTFSGAFSGTVSGIVNGIDTAVWDPARDAALAMRYDASSLADRVANKRAVEARFGLPSDDSLLIAMVTRLTTQKGIDVVIDAMEAIVARGARMVVLGSGDVLFQDALRLLAARWPASLAVIVGYDEDLSHRMQGGCDAILVPSRFEPCGLTQLYGLRYGCVPIVARVGGLADTVIDANDAALKAGVATGIQFDAATVEDVVAAIERAVDLFARPEAWRDIQTQGMRADVGWDASAAAYRSLYDRLLVGSR